MNSKERVKISLSHNEPDRVPMDLWAEKIPVAKLLQHFNLTTKDELLLKLDIDFRFIEGSVYKGASLKGDEEGQTKDIWGVVRKTVMVDSNDPSKGTYEHAIRHPLESAETVKEIEDYRHWPSPDWYDYSQVEAQCDKYKDYAVVCGGDRLNRTAQLKPAMYLRGIEQILVDLACDPEIAEAIFERETAFFLEYNKRIFQNANGKIDIFFMGDDFGTQEGLMMSLDMWRKLIKPGFKKFIDLAHSYNIKVMHHTCGAVSQLIPDFIDCGLDILQSLQPAAVGMDLQKIKAEYGKDICFQGGLDIQKTLPYGTPDDVKNECLDRIKTLGPGGGYILCSAHNMQADVPLENILSLYNTATKYGKY